MYVRMYVCMRMGRKAVVEKLENQFTHLKGSVDSYMNWVETLGGLTGSHFIHWRQCDARFTSNKAMLRGSLLDIIGRLPVDRPYMKRAVALAARQLPSGFRSGASQHLFVDWFTQADVKKVENHDQLEAAETMLVKMYE